MGHRILFVGTSGSGKTSAARMTARRLGLEHVELDGIRHGPNWVETPDAEFREIVARRVAEERWVIDGNYGIVRDLTIPAATVVVWIDPPKWRVMQQVIWRSIHRAATRQELWNGNRERWSFFLRKDHPIRWAWSTHARRRRQYLEAMDGKWVRLRSRWEFARWLDRFASES